MSAYSLRIVTRRCNTGPRFGASAVQLQRTLVVVCANRIGMVHLFQTAPLKCIVSGITTSASKSFW